MLPFWPTTSEKQRAGLAVALLAALALLFFWPVTLGVAWIPRGGGDLASFLWPTYSYAARALWAGRLPLWDPSLYAGMPFAADNQAALFYPVNWLAWLLAPGFPYRALEWLVVFHFWLAGVGMYALMRVWLADGKSFPALFAAIAYMFSDVLVMHVGNLNTVAVPAWLPWALAALHLALARRSLRWMLAAGAALGMAALAGHAQMLLICAYALGLYAVWRIVAERGARLRLIGLTAGMFIAALGLSAVAILPAVELTQYTARARLDYATAAQYSLPWAGLAGLFSPLVFGRGAAAFWPAWDRAELGYLGVLPLFFAGLAPFKRGRGLPMFLLALGAVSLLLALGNSTPVHHWLYLVAPGFGQFRAPARFVLVTDLTLAALAGFGLQRLAEITRPQVLLWGGALALAAAGVVTGGFWVSAAAVGVWRWGLWALGLAICLIGVLAGAGLVLGRERLRRWLPVLTLALLAVDVIGQAAFVEVDPIDPTLGFQRSAALAFLQGQPGPTRLDNAAGAWAPDAAARHGLESIGGVFNPLGLAAYQTYTSAMGPRGSAHYNFLNAQWIIADKNQPPADNAAIVPVFNEDPAVDVYLNTAAQGRVNLIYDAIAAASGEAAFRAVYAPGFDPARSVVIETAGSLPRVDASPAGASNLYYLAYAPEAFKLAVTTPAPAYLVFSEVWYPGWEAWVDGQPAPVLRADVAFRAVRLDRAGDHIVELRFDPLSVKLGAALTAVTVLGYGLAAWLWWRRRRGRPSV